MGPSKKGAYEKPADVASHNRDHISKKSKGLQQAIWQEAGKFHWGLRWMMCWRLQEGSPTGEGSFLMRPLTLPFVCICRPKPLPPEQAHLAQHHIANLLSHVLRRAESFKHDPTRELI